LYILIFKFFDLRREDICCQKNLKMCDFVIPRICILGNILLTNEE
jgi:hypothetical protein